MVEESMTPIESQILLFVKGSPGEVDASDIAEYFDLDIVYAIKITQSMLKKHILFRSY